MRQDVVFYEVEVHTDTFVKKKTAPEPIKCGFYRVGREGFEPPKASPIDLQSTPFDHSGISPEYFL